MPPQQSAMGMTQNNHSYDLCPRLVIPGSGVVPFVTVAFLRTSIPVLGTFFTGSFLRKTSASSNPFTYPPLVERIFLTWLRKEPLNNDRVSFKSPKTK